MIFFKKERFGEAFNISRGYFSARLIYHSEDVTKSSQKFNDWCGGTVFIELD